MPYCSHSSQYSSLHCNSSVCAMFLFSAAALGYRSMVWFLSVWVWVWVCYAAKGSFPARETLLSGHIAFRGISTIPSLRACVRRFSIGVRPHDRNIADVDHRSYLARISTVAILALPVARARRASDIAAGALSLYVPVP